MNYLLLNIFFQARNSNSAITFWDFNQNKMTRIIKFIIYSIKLKYIYIYIVNRTLKSKEYLTEGETLRIHEVCFIDNYSITNMYSEFVDITLQAGGKCLPKCKNREPKWFWISKGTFWGRKNSSPFPQPPVPKRRI